MTANTPRGITYPVLTDQVSTLGPTIQDMALDLDGLAQQLADRLDAAAHRPAARMSAIANQTLTPFVANTVTFAAEEINIGGMVNIPTSNTRIRITEQGLYMVGASVAATTATGTWGLRADITNSASGAVARASLQGNNNSGDEPTNTYLSVGMLTYADGATPADITVAVTSTSGGSVNLQDRSLWAVKMGNIPGGY
ncbi:hypothetical protein [Streptomyces drozdowiczii]|uniref:Minor tail protein n=1 Tax=Streptomyces drozdowiczii TaxID=202862 RepID=A0ABY6PPH2_9ACTN|nr:hypothetical protein [Streptomyces drozdowiczii]MCX0246401.1 hypothetical protein [Streptomyces drozdowiczii]UZK54095.1 hypothetical protein NEH16_07945 [Streptomyces drozdowiczii]